MARTDKEALALVLDVSQGMANAPPGFDTPLQVAVDILQMIVQRKMFQESKDEVALVLYGSEETKNDLAEDGDYDNVSIVFPLGVANWNLFDEIQKIKPGVAHADLVDAIVVAADHIKSQTDGKKGFQAKRVLLFTNASTPFSDNNLAVITQQMKNFDITLDAIGPTWDEEDRSTSPEPDGEVPTDAMDLDRPQQSNTTNEASASATAPTTNGHGTESKQKFRSPKKPLTPQQKTGIRVITNIANETDGSMYTFREALMILSTHQSKTVKPTATKYILEFLDIKIPICTYIQVKDNKPQIFRLKKVFAREPKIEIKTDRGRYTKDEVDQEIEKEEIIDGYRYGSTFVPISKEDSDEMKYQSEKCFQIIGFTSSSNVQRSYFLGDTVYEVIAERGYEASETAFVALVQALYDTDTVAIIRKCFSSRSAPEIGFVRPHILHDHICLFYIKLPFSEDMRLFEFDTLDGFKRNQPTDDQLKAVDNLITSMDLTHAETGENGPDEALKPELIFNPYIQRMFQSIARRAVQPDEPLSFSNTILENYEQSCRNVAVNSRKTLEQLNKQFLLKVTERKAKMTTGEALFGTDDVKKPVGDEKENIVTNDGLESDKVNMEAMATKKKLTIKQIGSVTPMEDFKTIIESQSLPFEEACRQLRDQITDLIQNSFGDAFYLKALACLIGLRETCIQKLEPNVYNDFIRNLKKWLQTIARKDFWDKIVQEKLTIISSNECIESNVFPAEAESFLAEDTPEDTANKPGTIDQAENEEDLLDLI
ncbi:unnamed protein product [Didymodactylos carnosus]|uniref:VWFA domain-containing protein n=1 Tax=Didymodactylos carnosus TaxID=1234261 RepID=A0A814FZU8_9BILA|nr:unnamed protein product [Didymodactylos carnosus]CAF0997823.1 unnamed protein product [Didymodactylos carnosus]CAF3762757.1 unnamed protein product [Didymodactylos carnosus]CAF3767524.1 unnamed protein product [Didymodactylos carnosus]